MAHITCHVYMTPIITLLSVLVLATLRRALSTTLLQHVPIHTKSSPIFEFSGRQPEQLGTNAWETIHL